MAYKGHSLIYEGGIIAKGATEICPTCGTLKSVHGGQCRSCQRKETAARIESEATAERLRIRRERQPRFEAALAAGWTLEELYRYHDGPDDDPVPTMDEIRERLEIQCIQKSDGPNATI